MVKMSDSQKTTKKELRLFSKKRKLESFLELIKDDRETSKKLRLKKSKNDKKKSSSNNPRKDHKIATKTSTSTSDDDISKESTEDINKDNKLDVTKDSECDSPPFKKTKLNLSEDEMKKIREEIRLRQKAAMEFPKIFLTLDPHTFKHQPHTHDGRPILYIQDIQHLILHATQGHTTSYKPRWCKLLRTQKVSKVLLIIVDGASCQDYYTDSSMSFLKANFEMSLEFISPSQYSRSLTGELFNIPVSNRKSLDEFQQSGFKTSLSKSCSVDNNNNNVTNVGNNNNDNINKNINKRDTDDAKADATNNNNINNNNNTSNYYYNNFFNNTFKPPNDKTSTSVVASPMTSSVTSPLPATKFDLMLTVDEMKMEGYTLPLAHHVKSGKYVFSKDTYIVPSDKSPIFAVDCEMVETLKSQSELAWISVVNEGMECIYESLVRPEYPVTDYLTRKLTTTI
ncbi:hypothetical protein HELRODRAFT_188219 [Helobdella robusta]|uniref:Exonuclease domain-containing protein n=1 Tax=Helobdella robusta TaxID=6412 RepID=T1FPS4_HELRO|nr:hypothetical protein HELRODRAFT_188219 [Helobdella robusta]ESO05892.1 hypothetical protein HELRODRAFT_188219 [Helobdella robusta]